MGGGVDPNITNYKHAGYGVGKKIGKTNAMRSAAGGGGTIKKAAPKVDIGKLLISRDLNNGYYYERVQENLTEDQRKWLKQMDTDGQDHKGNGIVDDHELNDFLNNFSSDDNPDKIDEKKLDAFLKGNKKAGKFADKKSLLQVLGLIQKSDDGVKTVKVVSSEIQDNGKETKKEILLDYEDGREVMGHDKDNTLTVTKNGESKLYTISQFKAAEEADQETKKASPKVNIDVKRENKGFTESATITNADGSNLNITGQQYHIETEGKDTTTETDINAITVTYKKSTGVELGDGTILKAGVEGDLTIATDEVSKTVTGEDGTQNTTSDSNLSMQNIIMGSAAVQKGVGDVTIETTVNATREDNIEGNKRYSSNGFNLQQAVSFGKKMGDVEFRASAKGEYYNINSSTKPKDGEAVEGHINGVKVAGNIEVSQNIGDAKITAYGNYSKDFAIDEEFMKTGIKGKQKFGNGATVTTDAYVSKYKLADNEIDKWGVGISYTPQKGPTFSAGVEQNTHSTWNNNSAFKEGTYFNVGVKGTLPQGKGGKKQIKEY